MLDRAALAVLRPLLDAAARRLASTGVEADAVTLAGGVLGIAAAAAIASGRYTLGLVLILLCRVADGLDGALARATAPTDRGAFLDIALDFVFYAGVPLGFALADPASNALAAAALLAAFVCTGTSFLAFAVLAERRGLKSEAYPAKGFFYLGGLTEGTETIAAFLAMCLWPAHFAPVAWVFAGLCAVTLATRLAAGWRAFAPRAGER